MSKTLNFTISQVPTNPIKISKNGIQKLQMRLDCIPGGIQSEEIARKLSGSVGFGENSHLKEVGRRNPMRTRLRERWEPSGRDRGS
ncbi:hypothetical protein SLA2020_377330 [Shorea laevis]